MKKVLLVMVIVVLAVTLTACGEKTAEKKAEKAIETATGGSADVDVDDGTITVNTDAGSFTAGEEVDLPDNFPSDIHIIDGTIKMVTETTEIEGFSVSIETSKSVSAAKAEYEEQLVNDGWTQTGMLDFTTSATVMAEKGNRSITVMISEVDGVVTVGIGTSTNAE